MDVATTLEVPIHSISQGKSWAEIFNRQAPLKVEVCSGKDEFLISMAKKEPETNFVGIERSYTVSAILLSKIEQSGLTNIRVIREDAHQIFDCCFKNGEIEKIFINFPDPWPKRRHYNRRLIQTDFIQKMIDCLVPNGQLQFASDHRDYIEWSLRHFEENKNIENVFGKGELRYELEGYPPTIFMKKYIPLGRKFHFLLFKKK